MTSAPAPPPTPGRSLPGRRSSSTSTALSRTPSPSSWRPTSTRSARYWRRRWRRRGRAPGSGGRSCRRSSRSALTMGTSSTASTGSGTSPTPRGSFAGMPVCRSCCPPSTQPASGVRWRRRSGGTPPGWRWMPSASRRSWASSPRWRTRRATSRPRTPCCTLRPCSASSRRPASTSATPPSTWSPPGRPRARMLWWRPPVTSRHTCSVTAAPRLAAVHGKTYQENKHTELAALADAVVSYAEERVRIEPPLDRPMSEAELEERVGSTISADGFGGVATMRLFAEELAPACLSTDHPRYLSFIPCAPSDAAGVFDLVVGAASIFGGSWLEGAGAVYAENQALRWIADLVGMPQGAGGVVTPGGTIGHLSALVAARHTARRRARSGRRPNRVAATAGAHSSIQSACDVMDAELVGVQVDDQWRLTGPNLRAVLEQHGPESFFAVVATCGTTNFGIIDDLASVAEVCREFGIWFHVDGAYGGAGLGAPSGRDLYTGVEHCDSFIVDPHKWLFAPFDCCALLYREPALARAAHTQKAGYLDVLTQAPEWNPTDSSVELPRGARGLPFWFSLAVNGTDAYGGAIEHILNVARL